MPANLVPYVKKLLLAVETRTALLEQACPRIRTAEERKRLLPMIAEIQATITQIISDLREQSGARFLAYTDSELTCLCAIWASIWCGEHELAIDSQSFANLAGRNNPEELGRMISRLLDGSSPLLKHISLEWHRHEEGLGYFRLKLTAPFELSRFVLGSVEKGD